MDSRNCAIIEKLQNFKFQGSKNVWGEAPHICSTLILETLLISIFAQFLESIENVVFDSGFECNPQNSEMVKKSKLNSFSSEF